MITNKPKQPNYKSYKTNIKLSIYKLSQWHPIILQIKYYRV